MLVKDKKAPEVYFFSKDSSGFECSIQLLDQSVYAKFVLGLPLRSKSYHKPINELTIVKNILNRGYFRQKNIFYHFIKQMVCKYLLELEADLWLVAVVTLFGMW